MNRSPVANLLHALRTAKRDGHGVILLTLDAANLEHFVDVVRVGAKLVGLYPKPSFPDDVLEREIARTLDSALKARGAA